MLIALCKADGRADDDNNVEAFPAEEESADEIVKDERRAVPDTSDDNTDVEDTDLRRLLSWVQCSGNII